MTTIYVLRLEDDHDYVGKTGNLMLRYQGNGAAWTLRYMPLSLVRSIEGASPFDEDKIVKELMAIHGIDKVRGGSYVSDILTESQRCHLQQEIRDQRRAGFGLGANLVGFPQEVLSKRRR